MDACPELKAAREAHVPHYSGNRGSDHRQQLCSPRLLAAMQRVVEQPQAVQERAAELLEHLLGSCLNPSL
jgi:hypothetical protein